MLSQNSEGPVTLNANPMESDTKELQLPQSRPPDRTSSTDLSAVPLESSVLEDLTLVDNATIQKLTDGLISHYLPDLQHSKQTLQELTQNQVILLETVEQEIAKFKDCNSLLDINSLFTEAKIYHNKLVNIRKEMLVLHERTTKLKKRALKLQQQKQRETLEKEQQHEKELERERQLTAKPAKRT